MINFPCQNELTRYKFFFNVTIQNSILIRRTGIKNGKFFPILTYYIISLRYAIHKFQHSRNTSY